MVLLLVEDEPYTKEGILSSIDWGSMGITKVLTADDGRRGLEMAQAHAPDIVLTDMYMPKLDGANMAKAIREMLPSCAIIFMSGYSDIAYYKSAIQVSAMEFVNKPLIIDELMEVLQRSVAQVKENRKKNDSFFIHRSNELARLIISEHADQQKLVQMWADYGMPLDEHYVLHAIMFRRVPSDDVILQIHELAGAAGIGIAVGSMPTGYVLHVAIPSNKPPLLKRFAQMVLDQTMQGLAYLAIGKAVGHPVTLRESYLDAARLMELSFYYPERQLFEQEEAWPSLFNNYEGINEMTRLLCASPEKVRPWIAQQFEEFRKHAGTPVELVKYWGFRMCAELYFHFDFFKDVNHHRAMPIDEAGLWEKVAALCSLDELKRLVMETMDMLEASGDKGAASPIVRKVQRYIYHHYAEDLSLQNLSEHVNLSITYLCSLFKETTGLTINGYILDVRIHRAKLMLASSEMHINEIAGASGFSSSSYFIKAFRKSVGLTPQEYRKECKVV